MYKIELDKIYSEDRTERMKRIPDKSVNTIIYDLSYDTTQYSWGVMIPFELLWEQYKHIIKDNEVIVLFGAEPLSSYLELSSIEWYEYGWVWDRIRGVGFLNTKKRPLHNHESISVFYRKQCTYNSQKASGHERKETFRSKNCQTEVYGTMNQDHHCDSIKGYPRSIQIFKTDTQSSSLHPSRKSLKLLEYFVKTYTSGDEIVLDNCIGSGTTAVACINTSRHFIGFEKLEGYYDTACKRVSGTIWGPKSAM